MVRQCAWCLYLLDADGVRIAVLPLPPLYEATHGMCSVCGKLWMDQAQHSGTGGAAKQEALASQQITEMVFQLQKEQHKVAPLMPKNRGTIRIF